MTTPTTSLSVMSVPVAATDRRALSQAWYSALHLADRSSSQGSPRLPKRTQPGRALERPSGAAQERSATVGFAAKHASLAERGSRAQAAPPVERRAPKTALASRIESVARKSLTDPRRIRFCLEKDGARVAIALQRSSRGGLRLVAMCPARVRDAVARAMAQARFALAARGIEVEPCF